MNNEPNRMERRARQRFELDLPLTVHLGGQTVQGSTQDVGGRGIFFYASLIDGSSVELTFTTPSEITLDVTASSSCVVDPAYIG